MITKYRIYLEKQLRQMSLQRKIKDRVYYCYTFIDRLEKQIQAKEKEEFYSLPKSEQIKIDPDKYFDMYHLKKFLQEEKNIFNYYLKTTPIKIN